MGSNPACPTKPRRVDLVGELHQAFLAGNSATDTLERWAARWFGLGPLVAERVAGPDLPPDEHASATLGGAPCRFRQVRLRWGPRVLALAENWFVPDRLLPPMNRTLATTDEPFGRVVAPLRCRRRTLAAAVLPADGLFVLEYRAALFAPDGLPVCAVRERITREAVEVP